MKFYDCSTAPSPRRVRMLIAEKGIVIETLQVDLGRGEHLTEAFAKLNPQRTVPVLELDDGTCLLDSYSISLYLDALFPEPNLTGRDAKERALVAMWQRTIEIDGLMAVAECFRNRSKGFVNRALTGAVDYAQIAELSERGRLRTRHFFAMLNAHLTDREHIVLDRLTVADISAFVAVEFSRAIKEPIPQDAIHLQRWHDVIAARPSAHA